MRLCAIMMQKDEGDLLKAWRTYHSLLLGVSNLYILDNQSHDERTLTELDAAEAAGVHVIRGIAEYRKKGEVVSELICELTDDYDCFFPLDCDEFVGVIKQEAFSSEKDTLIASLHAAIERPCLLRVKKSIWNIPFSTGGYFKDMTKIVVAGLTNVRLDHGFHLYNWSTQKSTVDESLIRPCDIGYLHFRNRPFPELLQSARQKLKARGVPNFDRKTLERYKGGGRHLIQYFFMSDREYMEQLPRPTIDLKPYFDRAGLEVPFSTRGGEGSYIATARGRRPSGVETEVDLS